MHAVAHAVGFECLFDVLDYRLARGDIGEADHRRGFLEAREVLVELEDAPVVDAQAFPDRIAALDDGVEHGDRGRVAVDEGAVDGDF